MVSTDLITAVWDWRLNCSYLRNMEGSYMEGTWKNWLANTD